MGYGITQRKGQDDLAGRYRFNANKTRDAREGG
jgi:hypothetical protein